MRGWPRIPIRRHYEDGFHSFISYSTRDDEIAAIKPVVDRYCEALRREIPYMPIFLDRFYLPRGHGELLHSLEDAIHRSDFTTAFLSPGYAASAWCGFEWWESYRLSQSRRCPKCGPHGMLHIYWKEFEEGLSRSMFSAQNAMVINIVNEVEQGDISGAVEKAISGTYDYLDRVYGNKT